MITTAPFTGCLLPGPPGADNRGMDEKQRSAIRAAYLDGADLDEVATTAGVTVQEADTYLLWWCDRACPGAEIEEAPPGGS